MNPKFKICIYLKNREKPIILTDVITKETPHSDVLSFFQESLKGENKIATLDFCNDNVILNLKDIDAVVVSKPVIETLDLVTSPDDLGGKTLEPMNSSVLMPKSEEDDESETTDQEVFSGNEEGTIVVVED